MAKSCRSSDGNEFTFEQTFEELEIALESAMAFENDERRLPNDSNDSQLSNSNNRRLYSSNRSTNEKALQRNRNHYTVGHYCHVHHTHHQHYHSNHSTHNHNNHHNNQNNRISSHSTHSNQQEMFVNEELDSRESHSTHGSQQHYTLDQTEFERIWRQLDNNKDRYNFLRSLYRSSPSGNVVSEISFGSLGDIASALCEFDDTVDDFCFVVYILSCLSRAKRFLLSLQFLTCEERLECKKLFHKLWKSMNDKQQDLAENDISELTINQLMKSYEIAIE